MQNNAFQIISFIQYLMSIRHLYLLGVSKTQTPEKLRLLDVPKLRPSNYSVFSNVILSSFRQQAASLSLFFFFLRQQSNRLPSHDVVTIETNKSATELFLCERELLSSYSDQMYTLSYPLTGKQTRGNGFNINKTLWNVLSMCIINQVVSYLCIHSFIH